MDLNLPLDTITWVTPIAMAENGKAANNKRADMFTSLFLKYFLIRDKDKASRDNTLPSKQNKGTLIIIFFAE